MFCPSCGINDSNSNQFCRACGTNLAMIRTAVEQPDSVTKSAETARSEIGLAIAQRIRAAETTRDLKKISEEVLPQVEKFLESPAERRLRRIRTGITLSSVGLGVSIGMALFSLVQSDTLFFAALGLVPLFLGLGFIINGYFLSVTPQIIPEGGSFADDQKRLDETAANYEAPNQLEEPRRPSSVTEGTTRNLG